MTLARDAAAGAVMVNSQLKARCWTPIAPLRDAEKPQKT